MLVERFDETEQVCDDLFSVADLIHKKFLDKGYRCVNLVWGRVGSEYQFCLQFNETEYCRFMKNMMELGYPTSVYPAPKKRYRWVVIENYSPIELLNIYQYLNKI